MSYETRLLSQVEEYSAKAHEFANKGKDNAAISYLSAAVNSLALYFIEKEKEK